jgi:major histocompatibility complex class I
MPSSGVSENSYSVLIYIKKIIIKSKKKRNEGDVFYPNAIYNFENISCRAVVAHTFNPSTREAEAGRFLSSRPAWSTQ